MSMIAKAPLEDIVDYMSDTGDQEIKSSLFNDDKWLEASTKNVGASIEFWTRKNELFSEFLAHVLHMKCKKPKRDYQTCVVCIYVQMGCQLGQFAKLLEYKVFTREEVMAQRTYLNEPCFKSDGPVVSFVVRGRVAGWGMAIEAVSRPPVKLLPPHKCDQKAKQIFEKLKALSPPTMTNPELKRVSSLHENANA